MFPRLAFYRASQEYAWENKSDGPCKRCGVAHFRDRLWYCQKCGAVLCDSQVREPIVNSNMEKTYIHMRVTDRFKGKVVGSGHLSLGCGPVMKLSYEKLKDGAKP